MGQQVGEAFVRVRPNMSGFKSETETGVKSSFSSLAKIAGLAFGGAAVGALVKSSVESAGQSAAITNSVSTQFGKLGKSVLDFASKQGAAFGSLETNTNQTSFALGKLFVNAGQTTKQAALMTTNWEKLGLALNEAKGGGVAGAASALQELQTVAAGTSTRGLHDLGVTITSAQIAARAAADGFIKLGQSASGLTPAQKQLVTFQLAMRSLPEALREAAANSHSFAAEQARLAVAWDNAKTTLGTALLPLLTRGATALANWLTKMERSGRLQHDFNQVASVTAYVVGAIKDVVASGIHVWDSFSSAVGGAKNALIAVGGAFALLKVGGIGKAATRDVDAIGSRIGATFANIRARAKASSNDMARDYTTASAKIIRQTDAMKKAGSTWAIQASSNAAKVKTATGNVGGSFSALDDAMKATATSAKTNTGAMNQAFNDFATNTKRQASGFRGAISKASAGAAVAFESAATGMKAAAIEVGVTIKTALIQTGIGLLVVAIGIAVGYIISHWDTVKRYTVALGEAIVATWTGLKTTLLGIAEVIGGGIATALTAPLVGALKIVKGIVDAIPNSILGISTHISGIKSGLHDALNFIDKGTTGLVTKGVHNITTGAESIFSGARDAWNKSLKDSAHDPKAAAAAKDAGKATAKNLMDGVATGVTALAPSVQKTISDALRNAVAAAHKAILASVQSAKNNLDKIGQDLARTIDQIQQKIGGAVGAVAGSPQGAAFAKLKKLIEEGAPSFQIAKAQAELSGQLQNVGKTQKQQLSSQLSNLTAAFNQGKLTYSQFETRLHKILREDGVTMAQALKAGGSAFAATFKAEVGALGKQARAIADLPAKYRGIGGAGGAADIKIIQPLQVIKQEQLKVRTAVEKAAAAAQKQRAAILKNQEKQISLAQQAKSAGVKVHFTQPQGSGAHLGAGGGGAIASQIAAHTRRMADTTQGGVLRGFRDVCADIASASKDIVAAELGLRSPMENLRRTELRIGEHAAQQRDRQIRLQTQTNTLLAKLNRDKGVPGFNKERPGTGSKHARAAAAAGVKP